MTEKNSIQVIDKLARNRIFISRYWKEQCFALNAQTIIDKAIKLKTIGGLYGGAKRPTKFMCLLLKMLQMNLAKQIALEYLKAREYKYLTALTLVYLRLTVRGAEVYELIEPFYNDNRKLVMKDNIGRHQIIHIDQLVDKLLSEEVVMGINLPYLTKRLVFQEQGLIEPRVSILEQEYGEQQNDHQEEHQKYQESDLDRHLNSHQNNMIQQQHEEQDH